MSLIDKVVVHPRADAMRVRVNDRHHPDRPVLARLVVGLAVALAAAVVVVALGVAAELVAAARAVEPAPVVVVGGAR